MKIELLYFDGCPNYTESLAELRELLSHEGANEEIDLRRVETIEDAERARFLGSPTVRVDGQDVDPTADERRDYGMTCRLYRTAGSTSALPPAAWISAAIRRSQERGG